MDKRSKEGRLVSRTIAVATIKIPAHPAQPAHPVARALMANKVPMVKEEVRVPLVSRMVSRHTNPLDVKNAHQDPKENLVMLARPVELGPKAMPADAVTMVRMVMLAMPDLLVLLETPVVPVMLVKKDPMVATLKMARKVPVEQPVMLDLLAQLVVLARKAPMVIPARLVVQVPLVLQAMMVTVELKDRPVPKAMQVVQEKMPNIANVLDMRRKRSRKLKTALIIKNSWFLFYFYAFLCFS